jgi:hypothetical protein
MTLMCPRGCGRPSRRTLTRSYRAASQAPLCRECLLVQAGRKRRPEAARIENARRRKAKADAIEQAYQAELLAIRARRRAA